MVPQIETPIVCDYQVTKACADRKGLTDAKWGYKINVENEVKFACEDCADEIMERNARDLEHKIIAKGDKVA